MDIKMNFKLNTSMRKQLKLQKKLKIKNLEKKSKTRVGDILRSAHSEGVRNLPG